MDMAARYPLSQRSAKFDNNDCSGFKLFVVVF